MTQKPMLRAEVHCALTKMTPLCKKATGPDARPVCAESADTSCWAKAASRSAVESVRSHVSPQELAVGVQGGMEVLVEIGRAHV